jgi:HD superfamily phosphohydrolase YqeK
LSTEILQSIGTARIVERLSSLAQKDLNEELKKITKETYKVIMEKNRTKN